MTKRGSAGALIDLASLPNLRDLDGHATRGGRTVRRGLLYRSTELSKLSEPDEATLAGFGLHAVFDSAPRPSGRTSLICCLTGSRSLRATRWPTPPAPPRPRWRGALSSPAAATALLAGTGRWSPALSTACTWMRRSRSS